MNLSNTLFVIADAKTLCYILYNSGNIQIKYCWGPAAPHPPPPPPPLGCIKLAKTSVSRRLIVTLRLSSIAFGPRIKTHFVHHLQKVINCRYGINHCRAFQSHLFLVTGLGFMSISFLVLQISCILYRRDFNKNSDIRKNFVQILPYISGVDRIKIPQYSK